MNITIEKLKELRACESGVKFFASLDETDLRSAINKAFNTDNNSKYQYANWLLSRLLSRENRIKYAIFAAELVIDIYEKKYPNDKRPQNAIDAAKKYLVDPSTENKRAAYAAAAHAADAAAYAAAADAADDAAAAAYAAAYAADDAADDAADAAYAADDAADAADDAVKEKTYIAIINYGLSLIDSQDGGAL